jgi:hypothetical protein
MNNKPLFLATSIDFKATSTTFKCPRFARQYWFKKFYSGAKLCRYSDIVAYLKFKRFFYRALSKNFEKRVQRKINKKVKIDLADKETLARNLKTL